MSDNYPGVFFKQDSASETKITPIHVLTKKELGLWLENQSQMVQNWVSQQQFKAKPGSYLVVPESNGEVSAVLVGRSSEGGIRLLQNLPAVLPSADYQLSAEVGMEACLGWGLACYKFCRYINNQTNWPG